jgi:GTP-binding protein
MSVSGRTGRGTGDLLDEIVHLLPEEMPVDERETPVRIALMGRPNVGKSSLVNSLVGENRVIVSDTPGTTRDTTDTFLEYQGKEIVLVDTAGLKRLTKLHESLEYYSYLRTQTGIARCDVAVAVIDAVDGLTSYEKNIIDDVVQKGKGLIMVVNKWDLIEKDDKTMKHMEDKIRIDLAYMTYAPIIFISALTGQRVPKLFELIMKVYGQSRLRITTGMLNAVLADATARVQPPTDKGKRLKVYYATQTGIEPPHFIMFCNDSKIFHFSYLRYLENRIREAFTIDMVPIRMTIRQKGEHV